jgi:acetyl esterase/lipase
MRLARRSSAWNLARCVLALPAVLVLLVSCGSGQPRSAATVVPRPASAPVVRSKLIPTPHRQWLNLAYADRSSYEQLDLYLPVQRTAQAEPPGLVVYVHGGGWLEPGNVKANLVSQTFANALLSAGYAVASVNYRLSTQAPFPAQIQDVKTAVRWLRAHARYYGYDPGEIAAFGDSAGGQLVALLATSQGVPALEGASLGYPRVSSSIKAAIVFYPVINLLADRAWLSEISFCTGKYQNPDLPGSAASQYLGAPVQTVPGRAKAADPMTYLTPGRPVPKFLIAQGMHDCTVPYQGAIEFYKALVRVAGPSAAELILEPTAGHFNPPAEVNFNFAELEQPALKLLRETIGPG